MMAEYAKNFDGTVCAMNPTSAGSEFSYCGNAMDGDEQDGGGCTPDGKQRGPVTCEECIRIIKEMRADMKTIRLAH